MASILKGGRPAALALIIILIFVSSSLHAITTVTARTPYAHVRQLARNCDDPIQGDGPGCGSGGGSGGGGSVPAKPKPCGSAPGSSLCKKGCCGKTKMGKAKCC